MVEAAVQPGARVDREGALDQVVAGLVGHVRHLGRLQVEVADQHPGLGTLRRAPRRSRASWRSGDGGLERQVRRRHGPALPCHDHRRHDRHAPLTPAGQHDDVRLQHLAAHDERVALRRPEPVLRARPDELAVRAPRRGPRPGGRTVSAPAAGRAPGARTRQPPAPAGPARREPAPAEPPGPGRRAAGSRRRCAPAQPRARGQTAPMHQRFSVASPGGHALPTDVVTYGPDVPREDTLRLLGSVDGKRDPRPRVRRRPQRRSPWPARAPR